MNRHFVFPATRVREGVLALALLLAGDQGWDRTGEPALKRRQL